MLSERERRRLQEIEFQLQLTDPRLVAGFTGLDAAARAAARRHRAEVRGGRSMYAAGPLPSALLVVALLVLVTGALAVSVPIVLTGIVLAGVSLGLAVLAPARPGPQA